MAQLCHPRDVFVSNGEIFICDTQNHRVRKVLRNGQIVTICGTGIRGYNGDHILATNAQIDWPHSIFVSSSDQVYISGGHRIRKIDQNGIISTIAGTGIPGYDGDDQLAIHAKLCDPSGLFVTEDEEVLFADEMNYRIRKIDRNGIITTIAGTGNAKRESGDGDGKLATSISLFFPTSVFKYGNDIFIADNANHRIVEVDQNGMVIGTAIDLTSIDSIFVHNDEVYFTDGMYVVYKLQPNDGTMSIIAGTPYEVGCNGDDMLATECKFRGPRGIFIDTDSQIYIADTNNHCIRRIDRNGMISVIVGTQGEKGYSGDVPFDFHKYPHIGRKKKQPIKPFPQAYHDLIVICREDINSNNI